MRRSIATIKEPEFLNINSISPLISECEIKVMYVGQNRNHSFITKEVATKMAETLPGCPIVGYYTKDKQDFLDHGERITLDGEGIKFEDMTKPYGFVSPNARIWFKEFEDTDEFGNSVKREYLMTTGFLWTGQYEECKRVVDNGNPQSMKLNGETLKGHWSEDTNSGIDFFIINDATFENLCILGEDVEPCFEGAEITKRTNLSMGYSLNDNFVKSLSTMMQELKYTLNKEGGLPMENEVLENTKVENEEASAPEENFSSNEDKTNEIGSVENEFKTEEEFAKKDEEKEDSSEEEEKSDDNEDSKEEDEDEKKKSSVEENSCHDDEEKKKYELLEKDYNELQSKYSVLEQENADLNAKLNELVEFKSQVETKEKEALIDSFYMLDDEDKVDVKTNIKEYSLDEIESKLSVICVRKKVNFNLENTDESKSNVEAPQVFNLQSAEEPAVPAWIAAVRNTRDSKLI